MGLSSMHQNLKLLSVTVPVQFIIFKIETNANAVDHFSGCRFDQCLSILSLENAENTGKKKVGRNSREKYH